MAGLGRPCMPSFSLSILAGQLLLLNTFGVPEILGLVAGAAGFLIAASPDHLDLRRNRPVIGFVVLTTVVVSLVAVMRGGSLGLLMFVALLAVGVLIGFCIRTLKGVRRFWFPAGIFLAFVIGFVVFSLGHYGQNNCWP